MGNTWTSSSTIYDAHDFTVLHNGLCMIHDQDDNNLYAAPCDDTNRQKFSYIEKGGGQSWLIESNLDSDLCVEWNSETDNVFMDSCETTSDQDWIVKPNVNARADGTEMWTTSGAEHKNLCLDYNVANNNLHMQTCDEDSDEQFFKFILNAENIATECTFDHDVVKNDHEETTIDTLFSTGTEDTGYFNLNFQGGQFEHLDTVKAWCVDLGRYINTGSYNVDIYSSYDPNIENNELGYNKVVDYPEYLPSINWLINERNSGTTVEIEDCTDGPHTITDREFQLAVWSVIDDHDDPFSVWVGEHVVCVVEKLVEEAKANMSYQPDCYDPMAKFGLLIVVDDESNDTIENQVLISEIDINQIDNLCDCKMPTEPPSEEEYFGAGVVGDPHFKTWAGKAYDFHGVCDLVLLKNDVFDNGLGMNIHMRTTKMRMWSYVSVAAIRIDKDILEVMGGAKENKFWINGIKGDTNIGDSKKDKTSFVTSLSKYPVYFNQVSKKQRKFEINLGEEEKIVIGTWNSFVRIQFEHPKSQHFEHSSGLLGSFSEGIKLARDNKTVLKDFNVFGQEWQVLGSEPKLFNTIKGPQHPHKCDIPSSFEMRRRLGESDLTLENAKKACRDVNNDVIDLCVFDLVATNDISMVGAY